MVLYFVIPCYYDENVLPLTGPVFLWKLHDLIVREVIDADSRVLFVNDGSTDATWEIIARLHENDWGCIGIDLAENVGEQNALLAGMAFAKDRGADCCITMDSDLQDDIAAVDQMVEAFLAGSEAVFGVRRSRKSDTFFERATSGLFYGIMHIVEPRSIANHSNYRLLSKRAMEWLLSQTERPFFLPTLASLLEVPSTIVYYDRLPRTAGNSGYNFQKRLHLGMKAIYDHMVRRWHLHVFKQKKGLPDTHVRQILE